MSDKQIMHSILINGYNFEKGKHTIPSNKNKTVKIKLQIIKDGDIDLYFNKLCYGLKDTISTKITESLHKEIILPFYDDWEIIAHVKETGADLSIYCAEEIINKEADSFIFRKNCTEMVN